MPHNSSLTQRRCTDRYSAVALSAIMCPRQAQEREERIVEDDQSWRGTIGKLAGAELDAFLARGIVARVATIDDRGWPYVVPAWFEWEPADGGFWLVARKKSAWALHLQQNPRVALSIDEAEAPYRKMHVQGMAQIAEQPNIGGAWVEIAKRMAVRYLGEHGPDYLVPTLDQPRWLIKVRPEHVTTWQGVDWARKYTER
jgi:PPOX class probable F420-dependent enzyme